MWWAAESMAQQLTLDPLPVGERVRIDKQKQKTLPKTRYKEFLCSVSYDFNYDFYSLGISFGRRYGLSQGLTCGIELDYHYSSYFRPGRDVNLVSADFFLDYSLFGLMNFWVKPGVCCHWPREKELQRIWPVVWIGGGIPILYSNHSMLGIVGYCDVVGSDASPYGREWIWSLDYEIRW